MYKPNHPVAQVRWVLVKDPDGKMQTVPLVSSNLLHTPEFIIEAFVMRFSIEILFEEARAHLGMETQRQMVGQGNHKIDTSHLCSLLFDLPNRTEIKRDRRPFRFGIGVVCKKSR